MADAPWSRFSLVLALVSLVSLSLSSPEEDDDAQNFDMAILWMIYLLFLLMKVCHVYPEPETRQDYVKDWRTGREWEDVRSYRGSISAQTHIGIEFCMGILM